MARSSGPLDHADLTPNLNRAEFIGADGAEYRVTRDGLGSSVHFRFGEAEGVKRLAYFIGAGSVGRSYVYRLGEFLFQAPVAWYASGNRWDLSPGFEKSAGINLIRPIEASCLQCHASGVQVLAGTRNGYEQPAFTESGVACARCHGSGEEHLARVRKGGNQRGSGIVNPAKLERSARDSVCAQCHLVGAIRISKGERAVPYRPGQSLFTSTAVLVWTSADKPLAANSHFEQLSRSACWRKSEGKLWCGSCHDPHTMVAAPERAGYYRARCLTCHAKTAAKCSAPISVQARSGMNCITCHMPSRDMATVQHAAQTDHTIPRRVGSAVPAGTIREAELVAFPGTSVAERELALAYAQEALERNDSTLGMRALGLLETSLARHADDAPVADQLAQLYDRAGKQTEACHLYGQVAEGADAPVGALINAGNCEAAAGKIEDAIRLWRRALQANPGEEGARANLGVGLARTGKTEDARALIRAGLDLDPTSRRLRDILAVVEQ
jgi:tetratricopeptide (TPR) repeat protein